MKHVIIDMDAASEQPAGKADKKSKNRFTVMDK
jgi:hypothetical protein